MSGSLPFDSLPIVGQTCESVGPDEPPWGLRFTDGSLLCLDTPWRVVAEGRIVLGDCDHDQQFGLPEPVHAAHKAEELIRGRTVESARIDGVTADLRITFSGGVEVHAFNGSCAYEGWQFEDAHGRWLIGLGGGSVYEYVAPESDQ